MVIERAKAQLAALLVADATIIRFTGLSPFAFGVIVEATKEGYLAFVEAAMGIDLRVEMHRAFVIQPSKLEPVYGYEATVYVPENWQG